VLNKVVGETLTKCMKEERRDKATRNRGAIDEWQKY
jgi:hypothetical protein